MYHIGLMKYMYVRMEWLWGEKEEAIHYNKPTIKYLTYSMLLYNLMQYLVKIL